VSGCRFFINQAISHQKILNFSQTCHYKALELIKLVSSEDFFDRTLFGHPNLFSLKRLPSEALIFHSGVFWSAPDNNFGGYFLEIYP
jgi:hypothetical protein